MNERVTRMSYNYYDAETRSIVTLDDHRLDGAYTICRVSVLPPHRQQGIATRLMREVLADADATGTTLCLVPVPTGGPDAPNREQLIAWYESFGFVSFYGETWSTWFRRPRPPEMVCHLDAKLLDKS